MRKLINSQILFLILCSAACISSDKLEKLSKYRQLKSKSCDHSLAIYKVKFYGNWKRELFPKHFPDWRPPAQWSKTYGRTHDVNAAVYRLNDMASAAVRQFVETGKTDKLDVGNTKNSSIFDEFIIPNIATGDGVGSAMLFLDNEHPFVSMLTKLIPSPDWFIGVDSVKLMENCRWLEFLSVDVHPLDGGTESGLTFSAPKWASEPQVAIRQITPRWPSHYAGSFFNPDLRKLPSIGKFSFFKVREYNHMENETVIKNSRLRNSSKRKRNKRVHRTQNEIITSTTEQAIYNDEQAIDNEIFNSSMMQSYDKLPADCEVSEWSEWATCTKSCGLGETLRIRSVVKHPERGGGRCPNLKEVKWCGSARACRESENYFKW